MRDDLTYLMDEEMADALYDLHASHLKEGNKAVFCLVNGLAIHKSVHPQYVTPDVVIGARRALWTSTTSTPSRFHTHTPSSDITESQTDSSFLLAIWYAWKARLCWHR